MINKNLLNFEPENILHAYIHYKGQYQNKKKTQYHINNHKFTNKILLNFTSIYPNKLFLILLLYYYIFYITKTQNFISQNCYIFKHSLKPFQTYFGFMTNCSIIQMFFLFPLMMLVFNNTTLDNSLKFSPPLHPC